MTFQRGKLLVEALVLIAAVRIALRMVRFTTVRSALDRWAAPRRTGGKSGAPVAADEIAWAVTAAGRRVPGTTCLVEALAAHTLLRRHRQPALLRIGVRQRDALALDAHAWVECDGRVVVGTAAALADYAVLS
jgi:hypothetical protein